MKKIVLFAALMIFANFSAQGKKLKQTATIGFYNVENLWDTVPSADYIDGTLPVSNPAFHRSIPFDSVKLMQTTEYYKGEWSDELLKDKKVVRYQILNDEFTPNSPKNYTEKVYKQKLENAAKVISELGTSYTKNLPVIVGLIEVENRQVIEDLIKEPALAKGDYGIAHFNSYDARGVDVAIIYQKKRFTPIKTYKKEIKVYNDGKRDYTRDIVIAYGILDGERMAFFMNHWPSRSGGEAASRPRRNAAAVALKEEMDKFRAQDPNIKLFAMGDFNDDPNSPSLENYLKAVGDKNKLSEEFPYFNLMYEPFKRGVASLAYQGAPNLFDQIIVSKNLVLDKNPATYSVYKSEIYKQDYMINREGPWKGYPLRSWDYDRYTGGYSDHFPAYTIIQREVAQ
ncbi:MAG: endonuclease [Flavobacteriaceae bacterium]|nr:endonuclease [Flavobacteriaceae bacterium]